MFSVVEPFGGAFTTPTSSVGGAAAFAPTDLTWALLYDASLESYANNDPVSPLNDWSGNNRDATEATDKPLFKTNIQNGLPGILFDGTNDVLTATYTATVPFEIFIVLRTAAGSYNGNQRLITHGFLKGEIWGGATSWEIYTGSTLASNSGLVAQNTPYIIRALFNGANSEVQVNNGTTATGDTGANAPDVSVIFSNGDGTPCNYYLLAYYESAGALSAGNRTNMWTYLNTKWAVY